MPSSISVVRCVGVPSSSTLSEPRRPGIVPSSTTVTPGAATRWPIRPANARHALAVEVAFEAVADRFVEENARPAGAEHDVHRAGGAGHGVEIHQREAHGFVDERLPARGLEELRELATAAAALIADLAASLGALRDHLHVHPHQRLHVRDERAVARRDHHVAVLRDHARHHLDDARIAARA